MDSAAKSRPAAALVLDFGGVITKTLFETHRDTEDALGLPRGTLGWRGPFAPEADLLWQSMQAEEISERDYWRTRTLEVAKLVGAPWTEMAEFVRAARGAEPNAVIRPEFLQAFKRLRRAQRKLAILSNELDLFYGVEFRERLPFMGEFDVIIDATYTQILKPDPRAYRDVLGHLDLPAGACVFVDDQARNIQGAREVGMRTVHFDVQNPAKSYAQALQKLGLKDTHHA